MSGPVIKKGETVLFIGDSITDAARNYEDPHHLGSGYALMAAGLFGAMYPQLGVKFFNRGISGNRVIDLESRWQEDCLALKPDWISVMVGINDAMRRYDSNEHTTTETFIGIYRQLLIEAVEACGSRLILIEPFVLPNVASRRQCREDLDPKIHAIRDLAEELRAIYIPLDGLFAQARANAPIDYWAPDGIHPTPAGHALMAKAWLQAVGAGSPL
ncbi:SGNH/GDSL hydrolase family protein [Paenibacillus sp. 1011MAR3C5]|uniref:SGNH/GDSL hydrolase family protein n=1 Tax=Paenibacillus sp. 1011MAR3C5 TaxID=1675787 RepID=UPI002175D53D|nr:SGNH/GDSL hydrolase family protein [Paenibacillus sp. 1011MAR3C5]